VRRKAESSALLAALVQEEIPSNLLVGYPGGVATLRYAAILPKENLKTETLLLHIPAYGENHLSATKAVQELQSIMHNDPALSMVHIYLDPTNKFGHSFFTNSAVNGPWATALVEELLPHLVEKFSINRGRIFLTGHSSGGWSAAYLQITYPEIFAGAFVTAPDPLDLRDFFGADITPGTDDNFYFNLDGSDRPAARQGNESQRDYVERVSSTYGEANEWNAYEAAWGNGAKLFDRKTGEINPTAIQTKFNLSAHIKTLTPERFKELTGKLHLWCGLSDTYFLERPTQLFCESAKQLQAKCEFVPARVHTNLYLPGQSYPQGLNSRIMSLIRGTSVR